MHWRKWQKRFMMDDVAKALELFDQIKINHLQIAESLGADRK